MRAAHEASGSGASSWPGASAASPPWAGGSTSGSITINGGSVRRVRFEQRGPGGDQHAGRDGARDGPHVDGGLRRPPAQTKQRADDAEECGK